MILKGLKSCLSWLKVFDIYAFQIISLLIAFILGMTVTDAHWIKQVNQNIGVICDAYQSENQFKGELK